MKRSTEIIADYFATRYKNSGRGAIAVLQVDIGKLRSNLVDAAFPPALFSSRSNSRRGGLYPWDGIAAGIAHVPFLFVSFEPEVITISARMPISPTKSMVSHNASLHDAISLPKNYRKQKAEVVENALLPTGTSSSPSIYLAPKYFQRVQFDLHAPESITKAEFFVDKVFRIVREKISVGHYTVTLKDPTSEVDLLGLAGQEWVKHQLRQEKRHRRAKRRKAYVG